MKHDNKVLANLFLLIAFLIFISTFLFNVSDVWFYILRRASGAALIGGIADWFAVTALFRHPLNLPIPHTNIIENNREKLISTVSNTVNDTWLGKNFLGAEINKIDFYGIIIKTLEKDKYNKKLIFYSRKYLIKFLKYSKTDKFNRFVNDKIGRALNEDLFNDLSARIIKGIALFIERDDFDKTYEILANYIKNYISEYDTGVAVKDIIESSSEEIIGSVSVSGKKIIDDNFDNIVVSLCGFVNLAIDENEPLLRRHIKEVIEKYKDDSFMKKIMIFVAQETNVLDIELLSNEIIARMKGYIEDIKSNPSNDTRIKIRDYVLNFVDNPEEGIRKQILNGVEDIIYKNSGILKGHLVNYLDGGEGKGFIKKRLLDFVKSEGNDVIGQFDKPIKDWLITAGLNTVKMIIENNKLYVLNKNLFKEKFDYGLDLIRGEALRKSDEINGFFRGKTVYAMKVNHAVIGKLVRRYLESLDHKKLTSQIESKIGNDLQYIRINGAIVGSIVGVLIALIGLFLKAIH